MRQFTLDENGLRIKGDAGQESLLDWNEIYSIHISKVALPLLAPVTYLTFDTQYGEYIEISNGDHGWQNVLAHLANHIGQSQNDLQSVVEKTSPQDGSVEIYVQGQCDIRKGIIPL